MKTLVWLRGVSLASDTGCHAPVCMHCSLQKGMSVAKQLAPARIRIMASAISVTRLKLGVKQLQKTKHDFSSAASRETGMSNLLPFTQLIQLVES